MKSGLTLRQWLIPAVVFVAVVVALTAAVAQQAAPAPAPKVVEYKVVYDLINTSTQSKALDAFMKAKPAPDIETKLRGYGRDGWTLVHLERETGFAIFVR